MDPSLVRPRLEAVFQDVFDDPQLKIRDAMMAADVEGWDSLTHVNLVVAVEKEFRVRLTTSEVLSLNNVGDLVALVARKAG